MTELIIAIAIVALIIVVAKRKSKPDITVISEEPPEGPDIPNG